jgi:hypothetical protein
MVGLCLLSQLIDVKTCRRLGGLEGMWDNILARQVAVAAAFVLESPCQHHQPGLCERSAWTICLVFVPASMLHTPDSLF